jgi:hypothetical protein
MCREIQSPLSCSGFLDSFSATVEPRTPNALISSPEDENSMSFKIEGSTNLQSYIDSSPPGPSFADGEDQEDGRPWKLVQIKHVLAQNGLLRNVKHLQAFSLPNPLGTPSSMTPLLTSIPEADQFVHRVNVDSISLTIPTIRLTNFSVTKPSLPELDHNYNKKAASGKSSIQLSLNRTDIEDKQSEITSAPSSVYKGKFRTKSFTFRGNYITIPGLLPSAPSPKPTFRVGDLINAIDITRHDPFRSYLSSKTADIVATANAYVQTRRRYLIVLQANCAFMTCAIVTHHGTKGLRGRDLDFRREHLAIKPLEGENLSGHANILRLEDEASNPLDEDSYVWFTRTTTIWYSDPCISTVGRLTEDSIKELLYRYRGQFTSVKPEEIRESHHQKPSRHSFGGSWNWGENRPGHPSEKQWRL